MSTNLFEEAMWQHVSHVLRAGVPRTYSDTEYRSAAIPCIQPNCVWELDIEWRDGTHIASLGTAMTEALLRDHCERVHGIPVIPEGAGS